MLNNDYARELLQAGRLDEILRYCNDAIHDLRSREQSSRDLKAETAQALGWIGLAHYEKGEFQYASIAFVDSLEANCPHFGSASAQCVATHCHLARSYRHIGRLDDAERQVDRALVAMQGLPDEERGFYHSSAILILANIHSDRSDYATSQHLMLVAMKWRLQHYGWHHPRFGVVFDHLSRLYMKMGRTLASKRAITKAIRIYTRASHTNSMEFAMMLAFLGDIQAKEGNTRFAVESLARAVDILRRVRPPDNYQLRAVEQRLSAVVPTEKHHRGTSTGPQEEENPGRKEP